MVTNTKISPKMLNPRDIAGNAEEEDAIDLDIDALVGYPARHLVLQDECLVRLVLCQFTMTGWDKQVWTASSVSVRRHVQLSEQVRPWDTLICCCDIKNQQTKWKVTVTGTILWELRWWHLCWQELDILCTARNSVYLWKETNSLPKLGDKF